MGTFIDVYGKATEVRPIVEVLADNARLTAELVRVRGERDEAVAKLSNHDRVSDFDRDELVAVNAEYREKWERAIMLMDKANRELADAERERDALAEAMLPIVAWERRRCKKNGTPMLSFYERAAALLANRQTAKQGEVGT